VFGLTVGSVRASHSVAKVLNGIGRRWMYVPCRISVLTVSLKSSAARLVAKYFRRSFLVSGCRHVTSHGRFGRSARRDVVSYVDLRRPSQRGRCSSSGFLPDPRSQSEGTLRAPGQVGASQWVTRSSSDEGGVPPASRRAIGSLGPSLASQVGNGRGEA
jgi:hypothetical protein